ncbi:long-chain-fatty acid--ACP ligase MbtM [Mycobacterium sp. ACS4331]|uniref:long-chain-fatty acid--ACP ligase MbtM n=1 Tax=Mycobacterium sp. ACS4331 TaxID=1834121 RepID=UPI000801A08A|nr:long-chain-fatty acid--ACP ligase MbtM [Mycobacterium sp. ACS4331]OBF28727.1 long-chain fatty acid--CoA ligase [Mycobacterium sp. ACS4331]
MSVLMRRMSAAMTSSAHDLYVLDSDGETWRTHPWGEVHCRAENFAESVHDTGAADAIALVGEPTVELLAAIFGGWLAGASVALLPGPVRGADPAQWATATLQRCQNIGVSTVFSHGERLRDLRGVGAGPVHDLSAAAPPRRSTSLSPSDTRRPAILQGTAGSTGTPKTACLSAEAVLANLTGITERIAVNPIRDVGCSWLPLYHDMGLTFLLTCALSGLPMWQAPTSAFSALPFRWLTWLGTSHATLTAAPNFAFSVLGRYASRLPETDLSAVRFALNGGEPVDCAGMQRFGDAMSRFGFEARSMCPAYGMAESTCAVSITRPGDGLQFDEVDVDAPHDGGRMRRHAILGQPIPGIEVRIRPVDIPVSEAVGRDVGEVEIRGASMMDGYLESPPIHREDWFRTGDLGYLTPNGLVVCGRVKELIHIAGRNVFPSEIERIAGQVPGVRAGGVVAVGTANSSRPGLFIAAEFRGGDEEETRINLVRRVASECGVLPAKVLFVEPGTLPRTSSGKLRRLEVQRTLAG